MLKQTLTFFKENFELAYSCKLAWQEIDLGFDDSCKIQLTKPEFENPLENLDKIVWKKWKGNSIPFIMNKTDHESVLTKTSDNKVVIHFDIITSSWYFMSGFQELNTQHKDQYGRFKYKESLQKKLNIVGIPVVNYYFDILKEVIEFVTKSKIKTNRKFSATITHDIDEVMSGWKHRVRTELQNKHFLKAIIHGVSQPLKGFFPWKNLKELSDFNTTNAVRSTFFLLPRNNKLEAIKNADYKLSNPYIQKFISYIEQSNHEIGIHGSYKTHDSSKELKKDIESLNQNIKGNRFHFLQYSIQDSSVVIEDNNLKFDTTLGFQEEIGFRNSICTPFKLYNFEEDRAFNFIQIPLNVMDCSLEFSHYMNLSPTDSLIAVKKLTQEIKKFNGNLCINWHNTYFCEYLKKDWERLYKEIINYLTEEKCDFKTCSNLLK